MPPKKKLKPLGGQTKLSFWKWPEASNHLEQEAATAIEKDDAKTMKNQHKRNLQNVRNKDFLSWHGNYMYCKVCSEASKSNEMSKEAQCRNFQNTMLNRHAGLLERKMALQGPEIRKWFEEPQRKGETKQNKAVLVLFKCVQWLCIESIPLVKFKSLLELLHDLGPEDSDFETNQHQLQFLHNFGWYLTVPFWCNWWRTERKLGKISNSNCPGWWKHRHLYIYSDYIWRHKVKHSFCNKHIMSRCHGERNSRCSVGGVW